MNIFCFTEPQSLLSKRFARAASIPSEVVKRQEQSLGPDIISHSILQKQTTIPCRKQPVEHSWLFALRSVKLIPLHVSCQMQDGRLVTTRKMRFCMFLSSLMLDRSIHKRPNTNKLCCAGSFILAASLITERWKRPTEPFLVWTSRRPTWTVRTSSRWRRR